MTASATGTEPVESSTRKVGGLEAEDDEKWFVKEGGRSERCGREGLDGQARKAITTNPPNRSHSLVRFALSEEEAVVPMRGE